MLFTQVELTKWKELKNPLAGSAPIVAAAGSADPEDSVRLLFMNTLDKPMDVSFLGTMKETVGVIALYGLRKHISVYSNHCVCLVGFVLVHDKQTLNVIVNKRSLTLRTPHISTGFISHTDIIQTQKVGMSPDLPRHLHVSRMDVHILDQTVAHGVYLSDRSIANQMRKWASQAKSVLHLWIMLRYTLAGFGGTGVPLLPMVCLEQLEMSGIPPHGDGSPAYRDISNAIDLIPCLQAAECTPFAEQYFQDFVRYIRDDYVPSMNRLQDIEKAFSDQDHAWKRFPVIYTERSRDLWATLSELPSLSLPKVESFLHERFIPKHNELFQGTPYDLALDQASVTVQPVKEFCLYQWKASENDGQVTVRWLPLTNRMHHCRRQLISLHDAPSPLLCGNPELSAFASFHQPLFMDSFDYMHHVYPYVGSSVDLGRMPSTTSIAALMVGKSCLSSLMKGHGTPVHKDSCIHEVTNPLLNISSVVVDIDIEPGSRIISKIRESESAMKQFCYELIENSRKVLHHLETKNSALKKLADETKHIVFRTEPGARPKEGFHHLIVLPEWLCLQNIEVASAFVQLIQITRHCMPMVGTQGVIVDNIYTSPRHALRLPFQCKSKRNNPLLLVHSDYGEAWDASVDIGSLFIHGPKTTSKQSSSSEPTQVKRLLIDNISGVNAMSEKGEHHKLAVYVLGQRNKQEAQESSYPSVLERFGDDLKCSSLVEIRSKLEGAFTKHIAKQLVGRVNVMGIGNTLSLEEISLGWLEDKEMMTVGKGGSRYMDVCIAKKHHGLQSCVYYICIQRQQTRIHAILYELCFSTNCVACKDNPPHKTGIYAVLA